MAAFAQHAVTGLASGAVFALLALAIVLVNRATGIVNVAQGQMATLSAFVCVALVDHGWAFWPAFGATVALSFGGGVVLHQTLVRPAERSPVPGLVALTVGLYLAIDGLDTWIWGSGPRALHGPFSAAAVHVAGASFSKRELGTIAVALACAAVAAILLARTKLGLGLRAVAVSRAEARRVGIRPQPLLAATWGIAAAVGAVAGVLAATGGGAQPELLRPALLYAFAAVIIGGADSTVGAVAAALAVGVSLELLVAYVHWLSGGLRPACALAAALVLLVIRPRGLLGARP